MQSSVTQDRIGTHIDWELDGVTARMLDWFWSNMEKAMLLWHPNQHEPLEWYIPPKHGDPIGSVHIAPQTWRDGTRQRPYIKMVELDATPDPIKGLIVYSHCLVVAGYTQQTIDHGEPMSYRLHQWESTDAGTRGRCSAVGATIKTTAEQDLVWADHALEEVSNWGVFLPPLYGLYRVITNTDYNPFADLTVETTGGTARYKYIDRRHVSKGDE